MQLGQNKRAAWEYLVVGLLIVASMGLALGLYSKRDQVFKERLLILELLTLRNTVVAEILTSGRRPKDVKNFFQSLPRRDPFGNPYHYDPKTGWVSSETEGYHCW